MATFAKSVGDLLSINESAASLVVTSSALDVSTAMGGLVYARFGRQVATASTAGANIRLEASSNTSGDNTWFPFAIFTTAFAACEGETLNATCNSGQKVLTVTSTTNLTAGDVIFIDDTVDVTKSEWGRIKTISAGVSVTLEDNLVNTHLNSAIIYDSAEIYAPVSIPEGAVRIRAVVDGSLFTQVFAYEVRYSLITGIA